MEPVFFVMAILGCGDDGLQCSQQRIEPMLYTSVAACQAAVPAVLERNTDVDYPVLAAACQPRSRQVARSETPRPRPDGG